MCDRGPGACLQQFLILAALRPWGLPLSLARPLLIPEVSEGALGFLRKEARLTGEE